MKSNIYLLETPEELVTEIKQLTAKHGILHRDRSEAWHAMTDAITQHKFMQSACEQVDRDRIAAQHRLEEVIKRQAVAAVTAKEVL